VRPRRSADPYSVMMTPANWRGEVTVECAVMSPMIRLFRTPPTAAVDWRQMSDACSSDRLVPTGVPVMIPNQMESIGRTSTAASSTLSSRPFTNPFCMTGPTVRRFGNE
jgi:hypothetical protein